MAFIKIDGIASLTAESFKITPDDRQTLVELDGGNCVQDYSHVQSGDKITVTCNWWREDFPHIWEVFETRKLVDFQDPGGVVWPSCRVRVLSYGYFTSFEDSTIHTEIEVWRI